MIPQRSDLSACTLCSQPILIAITEAARRMPLDPEPDPDIGRLAAYRAFRGAWRCRVLRPGEQPHAFEHVFITHFATCPPYVARQAALRAAKTQAPDVLPTGVVSLSEARRRRTQRARP